MPLQLSRRHIQRQDRAGIKIDALPVIAVEIRACIASRPVHRLGFGIVAASEPRRTAAVIDITAIPGFRTWLAARWNRPEAPHLFASGLCITPPTASPTFLAR